MDEARVVHARVEGLAQRLGKREISDPDMIKWANDMARKGGQGSQIRSFKDSSLGSAKFLLDVLAGMNLPMLIKLASVRQDQSITDALRIAQEAGRKYINVASRILSGK